MTPTVQTLADSASVEELTLHLNTEKGVKAFEAAIQSQPVKDQVIKDIQDLKKSAQDIKKAFQRIHNDLTLFDREKFKTKSGVAIQLGPVWHRYQKVVLLMAPE